METSTSRVIWKGAISFGLVHIPVALHSATSESGLDFDWLDKRTMDPIGYKRINKKTGKEVEKENIVKGISYDCLLYTSDAADDLLCVDLGGRRIIKKKKKKITNKDANTLLM